MSIEITARHLDATETLQDYARGKAEEMLEAFPQVEHIHVILDMEKHRRMAEVVVQGKRHVRVEAQVSSDEFQPSIDQAFDKVETQLRKHTDKVHDHKPSMKQAERTRK